MPVEREERPYSQFNFRVSWQGGEGDALDALTAKAGFQEVSGLGLEVNVAEYRAGNWGLNSSVKITGTYKVPDVTLKRGLMGYDDFYKWIANLRGGSQNDRRNVTIELMAEDGNGPVMTWELKDARPIKYTGPSLNGKGTDVAMEELTLSCEHIVLDGEAA